MADDLRQMIAEAIGAPGKYVVREDGGQELITFWQARAVEQVVAAHLRGSAEAASVAEFAALAKSRLERLRAAERRITARDARIAELEKQLDGADVYRAGWAS